MDLRAGQWQPPFCPNRNCKHHSAQAEPWPFKRAGSYGRQLAPHRIQRFTCLSCRRSFSTQTFATTYWMKKPWLLADVFRQTTSCAANRQIAHNLGVAADTVDRTVARLGRHCLLFHQMTWQQASPRGPVAIDGLETFEWSQFFPFHANVAVEADTGFFSFFTDSELRRKGRMTPWQRRRRIDLERRYHRPDPKAVSAGIAELLSAVLAGVDSATVRSDDHPAYRRPISASGCRIRHEVTTSRQRRDGNNALFEVNLLDLWIRHGSANHKRETIAWSKRRGRALERLAVTLVDRNYLRSRHKKRGGPTPGMLLGVVDRRLSVGEVLARRLFPGRIELPRPWERYYRGQIRTRALAVNREHRLKYAY
jgi:transposase-like protein